MRQARIVFRPAVEQLESRDLPSIIINPIFASNILSDSNAAAIESTINTAIQNFESAITTPVTVNITFQETTSGLGESSTSYSAYSYSVYRAALANTVTSSADMTALASLPTGATNPVNGNSSVNVNYANAVALGLTTGTASGTVTLNPSVCNITRANIDPSKYDLLAVTEHEIDEVLGFSSSLNGLSNGAAAPTGPVFGDDLFRYDQAGNRSFNTNVNSTAFYSINGGTTDLDQFNQQQGGDFSDWFSYNGAGTPQVQNAYLAPGISPDLGVELTRLDVLGYTLSSTPLSFTVSNLNDSGAGSLRQAIIDSNANGGSNTITFTGAATSGTITLTSGALPKISNNLTISGPGSAALTISGNSAFQIFSVNSTFNVAISGLTLANASNPSSNGGAVFNNGTLTISNCAFTNDSASNGGGIFNSSGGNLTITNAVFSGDSANASHGSGGGISTNGPATISSSSFTSDAAAYGGGIYDSGPGLLSVANTTFSADMASATTGYGGGIYASGTATITGGSLMNNSAAYGGGIFLNSGTLTLNGATLAGNTATQNGGGIENYGTVISTNCTLSGNSAAQGDAISNEYFATLSVSADTFSNNVNTASSGAGICNSGTATVINSTFSGNSAKFGGGIENFGGLTIAGSTFASNQAVYNGGGVDNETGNAGIVISSCTFSGNSAAFGGGLESYTGTVSIGNSTIANNSAPSFQGGGIWVNGGSVSLLSTIVVGNFVTSSPSTANDVGGSLNAVKSQFNLIGTGGSGGISNTNHNQVGVSYSGASLGALTSGVGPTSTISLLPGSLALQAGTAVLTTLNGGVTNGTTTTLTVADSTFLGAGLVVLIDSEQLLITAVSGTTVTVTRGYGGTTPIMHLSGANASIPFDQRGLARVVNNLTDVGALETQNPPSLVGLPVVNGGGTALAITNAVELVSSTTVTIVTSTAHTFWVGELVTIAGVNPAGFDGVFTITSIPSATTFTYSAGSGLGTGALSSATATPSLAGLQRSMVDSIVYTFSEGVNIAAGGFTIAVAGGNSNAGGTQPSLSWTAVPFTNNTQWVVTFSGAGVTGSSIADGAYTIQITPGSVTAVVDGQQLGVGETDTFYRLFGDVQGNETVNGSDKIKFNQDFGGTAASSNYMAALDYSDVGNINGTAKIRFNLNFGKAFGGFAATI